MRVLLVDNDHNTRGGLSELLREDGVQVTEVSSARDALASLARRRPDALVTDVRLPGTSGIELTRASRVVCRDLPVLAIGTSDRYRDQLVNAGASAFHVKPLSYPRLFSCLRRLTEGEPGWNGCLRDGCQSPECGGGPGVLLPPPTKRR